MSDPHAPTPPPAPSQEEPVKPVNPEPKSKSVPPDPEGDRVSGPEQGKSEHPKQ
jgi:hypothetical protein